MGYYYGNYNSKFIVCGGSGHGPNTPGKRSPNGTREFTFNQPTKMYMFKALKRCGIACYDVNPEGESGVDVSLSTRSNRANTTIKNNDDLKRVIMVSIHYNAYDGKFDTNKGGFEVHYYPGSSTGRKLATYVHDCLKKGTKQIDRGVKASDFHMLRETYMPAILSENGFMDDRVEASLMAKSSFQKETGEQHAEGICKYFGVKYIKDGSSSSKKLYHVQVGAYTKKSNAENMIKKLKKDGYPYCIVKSNTLYKVQVGAYTKKENAENMIKKLKKDKYDCFISYY
jgi:N-acetylmuramoyl-L-alanine amidase